MTKEQNKNALLLTTEQIDELTAIYEDYMYAARIYEKLLTQKSSVKALASLQMQKLGLDHRKGFPWNPRSLTSEEKQHFQDFVDEKIHHDTGCAYVSVTHTNPDDDNCLSIRYVPEPYLMHKMDMSLPSAVERYMIVFPKDAKIKDTEFFIDKRYKVRYTREEDADMTIAEFLQNPQIESEFRILITAIDSFRKHKDRIFDRFRGLTLNAYAAELTAPYENIMLEMLGSFAEKIQKICRDIYIKELRQNVQDPAERQRLRNDIYENTFRYAEQDKLIPSAKDFQDYVHIRHLMRHQWDTMDELGFFDSAATNENFFTRSKYLESYRRLCDKTMVQRMKSYIKVLYQMQYVMRKIAPQRLIREPSESKSKFSERVKEFYRQNPNAEVTVEVNEVVGSDKYQKLCGNLHKVVPQITICDDFTVNAERFADFETDYLRRSNFLRTYQAIECMMMQYCMTRSIEADHVKTWNYFRDYHLLSPQEAIDWSNFTDLRNALSHNYYHRELRRQLKDIEPQYIERLRKLESKIIKISPQIEWLKYHVYEYIHPDGLRVIIDNKDNRALNSDSVTAPQIKLSFVPQTKQPAALQGVQPQKIDLTDPKYASRTSKQPKPEIYPNGVEIIAANGKIQEFKMPNGININFEKQRISWAADIQFHTNSKCFNTLQVVRHKLFTDKRLCATTFWEGKHSQPVYGGDMFLMGGRHRAYIDTLCRLKEFNFKNAEGVVDKTIFKQTKTGPEILFSNGTKILLQGNEMTVMRGNIVLNYENRQEFAAAYTGTFVLPPTLKHGNGR